MGESILAGGFRRLDDTLACEGVSLETIAEAVGTPVYVYSAAAIGGQYAALERALADIPHRVHFSMKANSSHAVLSLLRALGAGVDIVSGGELYRARHAGFRGSDIVFSGVGKTARELEEAVLADVRLVNVESEAELHLLDEIAGRVGRIATVALRVNPEVMVDTPHPYTRTGERGMKFGIPYDEAREAGRLALSLPHVRLEGLDMHVGSQVGRLEPYAHGMQRLLELHEQLRADGATDLRTVDIGGGFPVTYEAEPPVDLDAFASVVGPAVRDAGLTLIVEPGRFLVGNAAVLLTRVLYRKRSGGRDFVIADAGMTELLRPSHYNAYHRIEAVARVADSGVVDVVGPICESGDYLGMGRELGGVRPGDLLAVHSAGAYGYVMSSHYNSRPRVAEVLVDGDCFAVATRRETYEDLVRNEPDELDWRSC